MSDNETLKLAELLERCGDAEAFGVRAWRYRKEILAALRAVNYHADLVAALEITKMMLADQTIGHAIVDVATMQTLDGVIAAALTKLKG